MKKLLIGGVLLIVLLVVVVVASHNSLIKVQSQVEEQQANIMAQLQRRADLIPNLIQTVSNYTTHETEVFTAIAEAREAMLGAETLPQMAQADSDMTAALTRLTAVAEAYPELHSDTVYVGLMDELAGTENRIAVARADYNAAVKTYNNAIRTFPGALFADKLGFAPAAYFEATSQAQTTVPTVPPIS